MVADDRSGPLARLSSFPSSSLRSDGLQSATFEVGRLRLELSASPGAARLVIAGEGVRESYVIEPTALAAWAVATAKLLSLEPAASARDQVAIRTPFLADREGRSSVAFEAVVSEEAVEFRLIVSNVPEVDAGLVTTEDFVRGVAQAAVGAGMVARPID